MVVRRRNALLPSPAAATAAATAASALLIHPGACVSPDAVLGVGVRIGAFAIVEGGATLGDGVELAEHAIVRANVHIGAGARIDSFAVVGGQAQMRAGGPSFGLVRIGARTVVRESVTVSRPSSADGATIVGDDCFLMANSHVGHDCVIGNGVTLANNVMLAGHVHVGDDTFVGGGAGVHQFVRIGPGVMIGGNASISYDVAPFVLAAERNEVRGLNLVGLRRRKASAAAIADLKRCYHTVFSGPGDVRERAGRALGDSSCGSECHGRRFLEFFAASRRGVARPRMKCSGSDGAGSDGTTA